MKQRVLPSARAWLNGVCLVARDAAAAAAALLGAECKQLLMQAHCCYVFSPRVMYAYHRCSDDLLAACGRVSSAVLLGGHKNPPG
jgi:hypothetical protein